MVAIIFAAYKAFSSLSGIAIIGPVLGAAAAAAVIAMGTSALAGADSADDASFQFKSLGFGQEEATKTFEPPYSYNWPYDFFSMVELIKIDAAVQFKAGAQSVDSEEEV